MSTPSLLEPDTTHGCWWDTDPLGPLLGTSPRLSAGSFLLPVQWETGHLPAQGAKDVLLDAVRRSGPHFVCASPPHPVVTLKWRIGRNSGPVSQMKDDVTLREGKLCVQSPSMAGDRGG